MTVTPADLLSGGLPVSVAVTCKYSSECTVVKSAEVVIHPDFRSIENNEL